jgi:hypothetical protein
LGDQNAPEWLRHYTVLADNVLVQLPKCLVNNKRTLNAFARSSFFSASPPLDQRSNRERAPPFFPIRSGRTPSRAKNLHSSPWSPSMVCGSLKYTFFHSKTTVSHYSIYFLAPLSFKRKYQLREGSRTMSRLIKILHIDPDYQITYLIYRHPSHIRTSVSLETAIALLKKEDFDLIVSEPHNKAILKKENLVVKSKPIRERYYGYLDEVRANRYCEHRRAGTNLYSSGSGSVGRTGHRTVSNPGPVSRFSPVRRIGQGNRPVSAMDQPKKDSGLIHK